MGRGRPRQRMEGRRGRHAAPIIANPLVRLYRGERLLALQMAAEFGLTPAPASKVLTHCGRPGPRVRGVSARPEVVAFPRAPTPEPARSAAGRVRRRPGCGLRPSPPRCWAPRSSASAWLLVLWAHPPSRAAARVLVNIVDEPAGLRGFLTHCRGEWLVLSQAEVLPPNEAPTRSDGALVLERRRVLFIQIVPGGRHLMTGRSSRTRVAPSAAIARRRSSSAKGSTAARCGAGSRRAS